LFDAGIPCAQFNLESIQEEYDRLIKLELEFTMKPTGMGTAKLAIFNDTCGNKIQIVEIL
jgi:hypothetical protein